MLHNKIITNYAIDNKYTLIMWFSEDCLKSSGTPYYGTPISGTSHLANPYMDINELLGVRLEQVHNILN